MIEALLGVPLLVLPGVFSVQAIWPDADAFRSPRAARPTLWAAFALAHAVAWGVVLAWTGSLTPIRVWAVYGAATIVTGAAAWRRGGLERLQATSGPVTKS